MADIFISYSKQDPEHTKSLAADLQARGYTTWWDSSMLPGDEFPDLIKRRIDEAMAVIVIWTPNSVNSRWVRAEAHRADDQHKLITVSTPGLDFRDIPMPFGIRHCEPVTNREKIYAALHGLSVVAKGGSAAAAPSSDAAAIYERGVDYYQGRSGIPLDDKQALAHFRKAADLSYAPAISSLGRMYKEGWGVVRDDVEAVRLFRKAAEMGNATAINNLGWMYQEGLGVAKDDVEAIRLYREAVEMGYASAINNLGSMYEKGRGVVRDDAEAARLYRRAAEMGSATACRNLAVFYEYGRGVERSREDARRWYEKAAELGHEPAKEALKRF